MSIFKNFILVVLNLIGEMWFGYSRKSEFYDEHATTKTKGGYFVFVALALIVVICVLTWLCIRIYR
ncbi:hypothetical protein [Paenibacillus senegalensis]|uniref:hypothetical protein n=1 Tax=Paenibacillus senegalensis TaxID=1465766 RepID=UPI0002892FEB|nr:hypothetical protein [Paenibacillus senegalensis]